MFDSLSRSWSLVKASARVLAADKELLVFPMVSGLLVTLVSLSFAAPFFFLGGRNSERLLEQGPLAWLLAFAFYVASYFVIFFCNSALVGAALIRLRGGDPTVADGFRAASARLLPIFGYAVVAATVGMLLRAGHERSRNIFVRAAISFLGASWSVATFLVVPVLVQEGLGPIDAVQRSLALARRSWGEQLAGNGGIGFVFALAYVLVGFVGFGSALMLAGTNVPLALAAAGSTVLVIGLLAVFAGTLSGIYVAAVYRYAAEGAADGAYFEPALVRSAFR